MFLPVIKPVFRLAALILSLILYALTILAAYGGRFDTDFFSFPAIMVLALPYLAIATLIVTILWFVFGKFFAGGLGVLAIIASWGPISSVAPLSFSKDATPGAKTFTVMSYNLIHCRDLEGNSDGRNRTIDYIINSNADIVCVQELIKVDSTEIPDFTEGQVKELRRTYPYWAGDPKLDMKVFSKYPVVYEDASDYIDGSFDRKRYTFYKVNIGGHKLNLITMHLSSFNLSAEERKVVTEINSVNAAKKSMNQFRGDIREKLVKGFKRRKSDVQILRTALEHMKGATIICGDFNDVPESYAYRLLKGDDLKDAYVETGFGPMITYNRHAFWFHLDQMFYRGPLKALSFERGDIRTSDHYPIMCTFEFTDE